MLGLHQKTRVTYFPTKEDRLAMLKAEQEEFGDLVVPETPAPKEPEEEPEYESIEAFVEFLIDDERDTFTLADVQKLQVNLRRSPGKVIRDLEAFGLKYKGPTRQRTVRGFKSNPYTLYQGNPMAGGSGFDPNGVGSRYGN